MWMIRGSLRTLDRLPELSSSRVQQSEVFKTMTGARGPYDLGGSAILLSYYQHSYAYELELSSYVIHLAYRTLCLIFHTYMFRSRPYLR